MVNFKLLFKISILLIILLTINTQYLNHIYMTENKMNINFPVYVPI